jgi:preprotein translocase subunit Sec61beta
MGFAMAKGKSKKGEGFHSAAGLIRYFDAEDETAMKIDPRMVVAFCIISVILVEALKVMFPS